MMTVLKNSLWTQFGASIDMLKNAIMMLPGERWPSDKRFFYLAYHTLVFLDYYLTIPYDKNFSSPLPFTITDSYKEIEGTVDDVVPDRIYGKQELLDYLQTCREKCRMFISDLTEEKLAEHWIEPGHMDYPVLELLLYNMRHVQHHAAQLNQLLRQQINDAPRWVSRAPESLP